MQQTLIAMSSASGSSTDLVSSHQPLRGVHLNPISTPMSDEVVIRSFDPSQGGARAVCNHMTVTDIVAEEFAEPMSACPHTARSRL